MSERGIVIVYAKEAVLPDEIGTTKPEAPSTTQAIALLGAIVEASSAIGKASTLSFAHGTEALPHAIEGRRIDRST